jgi:hypothetical protein
LEPVAPVADALTRRSMSISCFSRWNPGVGDARHRGCVPTNLRARSHAVIVRANRLDTVIERKTLAKVANTQGARP